MTTVYHKENDNFRTVHRGRFWFSQHNDGSNGTREHDPWADFGRPKDTQQEALSAMYARAPLRA